MKLNDVLFVDSLPTLDLHGYDALYAQIKINEFVKDNYELEKVYVFAI